MQQIVRRVRQWRAQEVSVQLLDLAVVVTAPFYSPFVDAVHSSRSLNEDFRIV